MKKDEMLLTFLHVFNLGQNSQTDFHHKHTMENGFFLLSLFWKYCSCDTCLEITVEVDVLQLTMNFGKHQSAKSHVAVPEKYHRYGSFEVCSILHLRNSYDTFFLSNSENFFIKAIVKDRLSDDVAKNFPKPKFHQEKIIVTF